ncbi:MAG TPA: hypothetical protein VN030_11530 [Cellvibrio sp.]|nr:hypothetical protein [Cellvibrio sp.]
MALMQRPEQSTPQPAADEEMLTPGAEQSAPDDSEVPEGEPASPEEEAEMQRAIAALSEVIYQNDNSYNAVIEKLQSKDVPPLNKLIDTTVSLVTQIDKKINIDEAIILPFAADAYQRIYELAETGKLFTLEDDLVRKGLMAVLQIVIESYGVSPEDFNEYAESLGQEQAGKLINFYKKNGGGIKTAQPSGAMGA